MDAIMEKSEFMDEDFLLATETARELYHNCAEHVPILDYHCHISPREIAEDQRFENIARIWLSGDHYKWRQMRSNGVNEAYITGDAPDFEKFCQWAQTLEKAIGNPLYHWSHLELQRYFGYHGTLGTETARKVWELCRNRLLQEDMSARGIMKASNVTLVCTTDDPADDLYWHQKIRQDESFQIQVLPAFRPDRAIAIEQPDFVGYMQQLGQAAELKITDFADFLDALHKRMDVFHELGCKASDHGLLYVPWMEQDDDEASKIFAAKLRGEVISQEEVLKFKTSVLLWLGREYEKRDWVMQLHFGVTRNNNSRMFHKIGPDTGFDGIYNQVPITQLSKFLNALCQDENLPKTILYSLNPGDNAALVALMGCFQEAGASGKIQQGSAWWFNDHKHGMEEQLTTLASLGLLGNFVGMLTDSRSFLSYTRHEYFRRIFCNLVGSWVEHGEYSSDWNLLEQLVKDVCYNNAVRYFGFALECV
jgi:glucuronate isomerase